MKQYKIVIAYDGTDFCGWIQQVDKPSVVSVLEDAFLKTFHKPIILLGASKTDAGVHAMGQVAVFKSDVNVDPETMRWAWNNILPSSVLIRSLEHDDTFNPHINVAKKIYYYHIAPKRPFPFVSRYVLFHQTPFHADVVRDVLQLFVGTHDFNAFYTGTDKGTDTIRTIESIELEYFARFGVYRVSVVGQRFLRHMVRRIVGAALAVASRKNSKDDIIQALATRKIVFSFPTAPAHGLLLYRIMYGESHE